MKTVNETREETETGRIGNALAEIVGIRSKEIGKTYTTHVQVERHVCVAGELLHHSDTFGLDPLPELQEAVERAKQFLESTE